MSTISARGLTTLSIWQIGLGLRKVSSSEMCVTSLERSHSRFSPSGGYRYYPTASAYWSVVFRVMPLFYRSGATIPGSIEEDSVAQWYWGSLSFHIFSAVLLYTSTRTSDDRTMPELCHRAIHCSIQCSISKLSSRAISLYLMNDFEAWHTLRVPCSGESSIDVKAQHRMQHRMTFNIQHNHRYS